MKCLFVCLLPVLLLTSSLFPADFDAPRNAFPGSEINAAIAKAEEDQRPVLLMYYDYKMGDPAWMRRSMSVLEALDSSCIVVYVDSTERKLLTKQARAELSGNKLGTTYPRGVMMDAKLSKLVYPIPQRNWTREFETTIRDAKREAQSYRVEARRRADKREEKAIAASMLEAPAERTWTDTEGRTLQGTLNYISEDSINVTRDNGLSATIPLDLLSTDDHSYLETYSGSLFDKRGG